MNRNQTYRAPEAILSASLKASPPTSVVGLLVLHMAPAFLVVAGASWAAAISKLAIHLFNMAKLLY